MTRSATAPAVTTRAARFARRAGRAAFVAALATGVTLSGTPAVAGSAKDWLVVGHRGGLGDGVQHSIELFDRMLGLKPDGVEVDVQITKDNVPVLMHENGELPLLTVNCRGRISDHTYAALKRCILRNPTRDPAFDNQRIPTLAAALRLFRDDAARDFDVFLHIKSGSKSHAKKIAEVAKRERMTRQIIVISSSKTTLKYAKQYGLTRRGLVFNSASGWREGYNYMVPYNVTVNPQVLAAAHRRGQRVLPVENHPHNLIDLDRVDVDGVLANNVTLALVIAGRLVSAQADRDDAAREKSVPASGPSRTTGPLDF